MANDAGGASRKAKRRALQKAAGWPAHDKLILVAVLIGAVAVIVIWVVLV